MDGQIPLLFYKTSSSFGAAALLPLNLNHSLLKQGTGTADHLTLLRLFQLQTRNSLRHFVRPSVRPSVRSSIRPSVRPSVCPSVRPFIRLSIHPSVHWFVTKLF